MSLPDIPNVVKSPFTAVRTVSGIVAGLPLVTSAQLPSTDSTTGGTPRDPGWEATAPQETVTSIGVGDAVTFEKTVEEADIEGFAGVTGDTNPLHLDDGYAEDTTFGGRIAHGLLVAGAISAALARLPGTVCYLGQDLTFLNPVYPGDRVTARVEIAEAFGDDRYRLRTTVERGDETVIDGEATILLRE